MEKFFFDLEDLDRNSGLTINDASLVISTTSFISSSDYNGDGIDDLIVLPIAESATQLQIIYGGDELPANLDLEDLEATTKLEGDSNNSFSSLFTSDLDFNGDGIDDLAYITSEGTTSDEIDFSSQLILGKEDLPTTIDLGGLDGDNGLDFVSEFALTFAQSVNINGDEVDDLIFLATDLESLEPNSTSYVFFGDKSDFDSTLDPTDVNGRNGFKIETKAGFLSFGVADDLNGDGFNDLSINFFSLDRSENTASILFGGEAFPAVVDLDDLDSDDGFTIVSRDADENSLLAPFLIEDINGDETADLYVMQQTGGEAEIFIIFGNETFDATLELADLNGDNGFSIVNSDREETSMIINSALDLNNDGLQDLVIKDRANNDTYVVFGQPEFEAEIDLADLNGDEGFVLAEAESFEYAVSFAGDINGDAIDDLILETDSDLTYVVFGRDDDFGAEFDPTEDTNTLAISAQSEIIVIRDIIDLNGDGADDIVYEPFFPLETLQGTDLETDIPDIQVVYGDTDLATAS